MSEDKKFPIVPVVALGAGVGIIGGGIYLAYQYFVAPGQSILNTYSFVVQDIMKEIKEFGKENAEQNPPIYGLTQTQKEIIEQKKAILQSIEVDVQKVLDSRNLPFAEWITEIVIGGLIIAGVVYVVVPILKARLKAGSFKNMIVDAASTDFTTNLCFDVISNAFALEGSLNIATAMYTQMQLYYTTYSLPSLLAQASVYQSMAANYAIGTWQYSVATRMVQSIAFETSSAGIMGSMYGYWMPLPI